MADCDRIEAAMNGINAQSKPTDANVNNLVQVMKELSGSHLLGSRIFNEAPKTARELEAAHQYTKVFGKDAPSSVPGAEALLQQQHGIANTLAMDEGDRHETLRLDGENPKPTPVLDTVTYMCHGKPVSAATIWFDGKPHLSEIELPDLAIVLDDKGKAVKIDPF